MLEFECDAILFGSDRTHRKRWGSALQLQQLHYNLRSRVPDFILPPIALHLEIISHRTRAME